MAPKAVPPALKSAAWVDKCPQQETSDLRRRSQLPRQRNCPAARFAFPGRMQEIAAFSARQEERKWLRNRRPRFRQKPAPGLNHQLFPRPGIVRDEEMTV